MNHVTKHFQAWAEGRLLVMETDWTRLAREAKSTQSLQPLR